MPRLLLIIALAFVLRSASHGANAQDLDAIEADIDLIPTGCVYNFTSLYGNNIAFTTNGSSYDFYCDTRFVTDDLVFESLFGYSISDENFTCDPYWTARFPDTGQCLFATGLSGISCRRWRMTSFNNTGGSAGFIYRTILTVSVTEDLDRVTFICNRGQRPVFRSYNHSSLLVQSVPETQPDFLPFQFMTGITVGSALLVLLLVQGVILLYSSPDF